jgi:ABC-type phosphate transport system substrate-binding protein
MRGRPADSYARLQSALADREQLNAELKTVMDGLDRKVAERTASYVELTYALQKGMTVGRVGNSSGAFVKAGLASVSAGPARRAWISPTSVHTYRQTEPRSRSFGRRNGTSPPSPL